jgi:hypothetical protein
MNAATAVESPEERKARIHAGVMAAFEDAVRHHFTNPPSTWTVRKVADRYWTVVDPHGTAIETHPTKKTAEQARASGTHVSIWHQKAAWYRGESRDPRSRTLTDEERAIAARVLLEVGEPLPVAWWWALTVFHEADIRSAWWEPAITLCPTYDTAIGVLRSAFADDLAGADEPIAADDLLDWLLSRGIRASIEHPYIECPRR